MRFFVGGNLHNSRLIARETTNSVVCHKLHADNFGTLGNVRRLERAEAQRNLS